MPTTLINVRVRPDGNCVILEGDNHDVMTSTGELKARLDQKAAAIKAGGGKTNADFEVVLRPDKNSTWEHLSPLYDAALRANFEKVSFATVGSKAQ